MNLWYYIVDFFTTSDVEQMYHQYCDLVDTLQDQLEKAEDYQTTYTQQFSTMTETMNPQDGAASGTLQDAYTRAFDCFKQNTQTMQTTFDNAIPDLQEKLQDAIEQREYYKQLMEAEDAAALAN